MMSPGTLASFEFAKEAQLEQRFNCAICLSPKLRMVYGVCQHRLCEQCLYTANGVRREVMERCPLCQKQDSFPLKRPDIPDENVDMQTYLGIRRCSQQGCNEELWFWERIEHQKNCHKKFLSKCKGQQSNKGAVKKTRSRRLHFLGPVTRDCRRVRDVLRQSHSQLNNRSRFNRHAKYSQTYTHCFQ